MKATGASHTSWGIGGIGPRLIWECEEGHYGDAFAVRLVRNVE